MGHYVVLAPVGDNLDAIYIGIKEFPTERLILITPSAKLKEAEKIREDLAKFRISVKIKEITGNIMEEMFKVFAEVRADEGNHPLLVNVASGDRMSTCAALSAAFVNGFKAFGVVDNRAMLLPVLKFSYYKILTDKKMNILKILPLDKSIPIEELCKKLKMSPPLLSYHIHGTLKAAGLVELGLVEAKEEARRVHIELTTMGKLLIRGYMP